MADLKTQTAIKNPLQDQAIRGREHLAAAGECKHRPPINVLNAAPMAGPAPSRISLLSRSQNLKLHLLTWKPSDPNALATAQRVSLGLSTTLEAVLIQEHFVQTAEAGMSARPKIPTATSSPSAPSLEELNEDLKALAAFKPAMPGDLAEALKVFQSEYNIYVSEEKLLEAKHPSPHNHSHPDEPQPKE